MNRPLALLAPLAFSSAVSLLGGCVTTRIDGRLLSKAPGPSWSLAPNACRSGDADDFQGVLLERATGVAEADKAPGTTIKLASDRSAGGWTLTVIPSGSDEPYTLTSTECRHLDVQATTDGKSWRGSALIDCDTPSGGSLSGELRFSGCSTYEWSLVGSRPRSD